MAMDLEMVIGDGEFLEGDDLDLDVDPEYEFDAARFFDFSCNESLVKFREAECWFETAGSYPPSPFVEAINAGKDDAGEDVNMLPKHSDEESTNPILGQSELNSDVDFSELDKTDKGLGSHNDALHDLPTNTKNFSVRNRLLRTSTLMKPTASHLAKQNKKWEVKIATQLGLRYQKPLVVKNEKSFEDTSEDLCQAAKRQKLEGGRLFKFKVTDARHPKDWIHKVPQKKSRFKPTIPREPELVTAQRAQRVRIKIQRSTNVSHSQDGSASISSTLKACPLTKKILEASSLPLPQKSKPRLPEFREFKLKTSGGSIQHALATPSLITNSTTQNSSTKVLSEGLQRPKASQLRKNGKPDGCGLVVTKSKVRTLHMKEFNAETTRRCPEKPPTELFSKLSLNSEGQQTNTSHAIYHQPIPVTDKGLKENIIDPEQQEPKRERLQRVGALPSFGIQSNVSRSFGIR